MFKGTSTDLSIKVLFQDYLSSLKMILVNIFDSKGSKDMHVKLCYIVSETLSVGHWVTTVSTESLSWASPRAWPDCGVSRRASARWTTKNWVELCATTKAATSWTKCTTRSSPIALSVTFATLSASAPRNLTFESVNTSKEPLLLLN